MRRVLALAAVLVAMLTALSAAPAGSAPCDGLATARHHAMATVTDDGAPDADVADDTPDGDRAHAPTVPAAIVATVPGQASLAGAGAVPRAPRHAGVRPSAASPSRLRGPPA